MTTEEDHETLQVRPVSLTVFAALMGCVLCGLWHWVEGIDLLLAPVLIFVGFIFAGREYPESRRVTSYAIGAMSFVFVFVAADLFLYATEQPLLSQLFSRLTVSIEYEEQVQASFTQDTCPRWYLKESEGNDEHGWRHHANGNNPDQTILLLGDSVTFGGIAHQITEGYRAAELPIRVVDTSVPGYNSIDEKCVLDQALTEWTPDLVVIGVCLNDFTDAVHLNLDIGAGAHDYFWGAIYNSQIEKLQQIPLLIEPTNTWLEHNTEVLQEFGDKIVIGFDDGSIFFEGVKKLGRLDSNITALLEMHQTLKTANIPTVFVVFPVNYHIRPNPTAGLYQYVHQALKDAGATVVDLYTLYDSFTAQELQPEGNAYDVIHYNEAALALSAHEALKLSGAALGPVEIDKVLSQIRLRLTESYNQPNMANALKHEGSE